MPSIFFLLWEGGKREEDHTLQFSTLLCVMCMCVRTCVSGSVLFLRVSQSHLVLAFLDTSQAFRGS